MEYLDNMKMISLSQLIYLREDKYLRRISLSSLGTSALINQLRMHFYKMLRQQFLGFCFRNPCLYVVLYVCVSFNSYIIIININVYSIFAYSNYYCIYLQCMFLNPKLSSIHFFELGLADIQIIVVDFVFCCDVTTLCLQQVRKLQIIDLESNMMANNQSINFGEDESIHIEKPKTVPFSNYNNQKSNGIKIREAFPTGKYINVVQPHKSTGKLVVNPDFQQFLSYDNSNPTALVVSFLGPKKIGKSFLLDNILSYQTAQVRRIMSKNNQQLLNSPSLNSTNYQGERIIYFDNSGTPAPSMFLWLYFISSIMVYNLSPANENEEGDLIECLVHTHNNIQSHNVKQLTKPQLIIVRRDTGNKQLFDFDLVRKIEQFQLFMPNIIVMHMPYPGNKNVLAKQLLDVPVKQLDQIFLNQVNRLHSLIRAGKPKKINGNSLTPQTLSIILQPLTKCINNQQVLSTRKIWNQVYQSLSISYYNNYLKNYSDELQKQFQSEQPCDKYTMYQKLSKIRRRVNKKMQKYNAISNQPTFHKYKQKLEQTLKNKEQLVKSVNAAKSKEFHQNNYNKLMQNLGSNNNYNEFIDGYCKSNLDDQKTQVLIENLDRIIKSKQGSSSVNSSPPLKQSSPPIRVSTQPKPPSQQLLKLNRELQQIQRTIASKSKIPPPSSQNFDAFKSSIDNKRNKLNQLKQQFERLNGPQFILSEEPQHSQLNQLQDQKQKLNQQLKNYEQEIVNLEQLKQSKLQQKAARLHDELRRQQQNVKMLKSSQIKQAAQQRPYQSKMWSAGTSTKKTCCSIM